jgi:hypothetical protein
MPPGAALRQGEASGSDSGSLSSSSGATSSCSRSTTSTTSSSSSSFSSDGSSGSSSSSSRSSGHSTSSASRSRSCSSGRRPRSRGRRCASYGRRSPVRFQRRRGDSRSRSRGRDRGRDRDRDGQRNTSRGRAGSRDRWQRAPRRERLSGFVRCSAHVSQAGCSSRAWQEARRCGLWCCGCAHGSGGVAGPSGQDRRRGLRGVCCGRLVCWLCPRPLTPLQA